MFRVKNNEFVIPGQLVGTDIRHDSNCFREGGNVYSSVQGLARIEDNTLKIIPSSGGYTPKEGDVVIGVVKDVLHGKWLVDIDASYPATMDGEEVTRNPQRVDLRDYFRVGDILSAKIFSVDEIHASKLGRPSKLEGGYIININPKRVPRVIGKNKSMVNMLREKTNSRIVVGQNGRVWINSANTAFVVSVVRKIEREAQTSGLTDRIEKLLNNA